MKAAVVFALEHAGWPALLVDTGGVILRANHSAVKVFGPVVEGEKPLLEIALPRRRASPGPLGLSL